MLNKVITIVLLLCLILGISIITVTAVGETRQGGGRGGIPPMGEKPSGDFTPPEGLTPSEGFTSPEGFTPPDGEFTPPQNAGEFTLPQNDVTNDGTEAAEPKAEASITEGNEEKPGNREESGQAQSGNQRFGGQAQGGNSPFGGQMPDGMGGFPGNMQNAQNTASSQPASFSGFLKTYSTPLTSVVLLGLAFIFVIFYRRKNY